MKGDKQQVKRLIFSGLKVFLTFLILYILFVFTFCRLQLNNSPLIYRFVKGLVWKGGYTLPRFRDFNPEEKYDILVFGSSTANRSVNPTVFAKRGIRVYNLGTDDQTPLNTEILVKHYVKAAQPKVVILDIYDRVFCQSSYEATADFIQNGDSHAAAVKMALQQADIRTLNMLAVRLATSDMPAVMDMKDTLINGFRPIRHRIRKFTPDNYRYQRDEEQLEAFTRTLNFLQREKVKVLLTVQPRPVFYLKENHLAFMKDIAPILKRYALQLAELSMNETGLRMSDFADMAHLNQYGAEKYSTALLAKISNYGLIAGN